MGLNALETAAPNDQLRSGGVPRSRARPPARAPIKPLPATDVCIHAGGNTTQHTSPHHPSSPKPTPYPGEYPKFGQSCPSKPVRALQCNLWAG